MRARYLSGEIWPEIILPVVALSQQCQDFFLDCAGNPGDLLGPVRDAGVPHMTKDVTALLGYIFVVTVVNPLGTQRVAPSSFALLHASVPQEQFAS
jgi:hypothetical protein